MADDVRCVRQAEPRYLIDPSIAHTEEDWRRRHARCARTAVASAMMGDIDSRGVADRAAVGLQTSPVLSSRA